mmetsp:Transcript_26443/g.105830  ORF Transcript_26443/g.105830 Transcript_26443/m.105830 type:complete len:425 (+) Transcript_26443:4697-5971(+)
MRPYLADSDDSLVALSATPASSRLVLTTSQGFLLTPSCGHSTSTPIQTWSWLSFDVLDAVDDPVKAKMPSIFGTQNASTRNGLISNSHACVGDVVYVPLAIGLAAVDVATPGEVRLLKYWAVPPYVGADRLSSQFMNRLGPYGTGSSPTAFGLSSSSAKKTFVTITDGQVQPMRLWVFSDDDAAPTVVNVTFGASPFSTSEQSVSVLVEDDAKKASLVVVNNYAGLANFDTADPNVWSTTGADLEKAAAWVANTTEGQAQYAKGHVNIAISPVVAATCAAGVNRYDFDGATLKLQWSNTEVCSQTAIPLQTPRRVWLVGALRAAPTAVGLVALDRASGAVDLVVPLPEALASDASFDPLTAFDAVLGLRDLDLEGGFGVTDRDAFNRLLLKNIQYADVETDGDAVLFGTVGGLVRVVVQGPAGK